MADLSITAANVLRSSGGSLNNSYTASGPLTQGQCVYLNSSSPQQWAPVTASGTQLQSGYGTTFGIVLNAPQTGQPVTVFVPTIGSSSLINLGATLVINQIYCVSQNGGGLICPFGDLSGVHYLTILGVAVSTSLLDMENALATGNTFTTTTTTTTTSTTTTTTTTSAS